MLNIYELNELEDKILKELPEHLTSALSFANRSGELEKLLKLLHLDHLLQRNSYEPPKKGKILVIGQSELKKDKILGVVRSLGLEKDRFEFCLEYDDAKTFNFNKLQWNMNYSLVLFGPMPHKCIGIGDYGSAISMMEQEDGYPHTIRLGSNDLKMTKASLKEGLQDALELGYIVK